jgi:hypothetical protein
MLINFFSISTFQLRLVPISKGGQLLSTQELDPREHQIMFGRMGEYATDVIFQHEHLSNSLNKIYQEVDKAIERIEVLTNLFTKNP